MVIYSRRNPTPIEPHQARIAVVEDDVMIADLLAMALRLRLKPAELHCCNRGRDGIEFCRANPPHLLIVDLGLPDMDGREVIRAVHEASPETRIIVLTGQATPSLATELLNLRVHGYVDKGSALTHVETAIARVLEGGIYFSAGSRAATSRAGRHTAAGASPSPDVLTEREREIVRLVARGKVSKEIGAELKLSPRTIEKARARIAEKLHIRDLPALIKWSIEHDLT